MGLLAAHPVSYPMVMKNVVPPVPEMSSFCGAN